MWILMVAVALAIDSESFVNIEVSREIDLTGHYTSIKSTITLENQGKSTVSKYFHAMEISNLEKLSNIRAYFKDDAVNFLKADFQEQANGFAIFKVLIPQGIQSKTRAELVIEEYFAERMHPFPKKIGIFDQQLMLFTDSIYYLSPYFTNKQNLLVKLPNSDVESYTKPSGIEFDLRGKQLTYGPVKQISGFSRNEFQVHFGNPKPMPYFTKVVREIEVSHWGNIAVSEWYTLVNKGAELKGEFSRFDYTARHRTVAVNALKSLEATLPRSAWGLYYRDHVGNVSTSHARQHSSYVHLSIEPRFPIMGGWKDTFNIGYNLPTKYFIKNKDEQFVLNMTFGFPFKEIIAEEMTVRVILPQGSHDIHPVLPFDVDHTSFTEEFSFLDFAGKPVIVLDKKNVMDFHRKPFQIVYKVPQNEMILKPLILAFYFFVALLLLIVSFRIDLSLEKENKIKTE